MGRTLRILIVEDKEEQAKLFARMISDNSAFKGMAPDISLANNAYYVAKRIREAKSPDELLWDIVIADIYMPRPTKAQADSPHPPIDYDPKVGNDDGWTTWRSKLQLSSESPEHGGLLIAQEVKKLKQCGKGWWKDHPLKLIVVSAHRNLLSCAAAVLENLYAQGNEDFKVLRGWLYYRDKPDLPALIPGDGPRLPAGLFEEAIVGALRDWDCDHWGDAVFADIEGPIPYFLLPGKLQTVVEGIKRAAKDRSIRNILIAGETGTGKEVLAKLGHKLRMLACSGNYEPDRFVSVPLAQMPFHPSFERLFFAGSQASFVERAANGTLFLDELVGLRAEFDALFAGFLKEWKYVKGQETMSFEGKQIIATTARLGDVKPSLINCFDHTVQVPSLDEMQSEGTAVALARLAAQSVSGCRGLDDEAIEFIRRYTWPGNARQLTKTVTVAAGLAGSRRAISAADLSSASASTSKWMPPTDSQKPKRGRQRARGNPALESTQEEIFTRWQNARDTKIRQQDFYHDLEEDTRKKARIWTFKDFKKMVNTVGRRHKNRSTSATECDSDN